MLTHLMLDLETLGTAPGSIILSVGAVKFDPKTGEVGDAFYQNVDRVRSKQMGLREDPETVLWWSKQSREAQNALETDCVPFGEMHADFLKFFKGCDRVWAQGASFDPVLYEAACRVAKVAVPWKYWMMRDTRTVYDLAGLDDRKVKREGTYHRADDDCRHQIKCVSLAWARIEATAGL